jgi:hypothetical protein
MDIDRSAYGHPQQLGGARLVTLEDGAERGVRAVEFRTTTGLEFASIVDRCMDIGWFRFGGRSLAWHSPAGFAGPWYREPDGMGFLRTFPGGLVVTCGLDHILFPQDDAADTYLYPGRSGTSYGLHGRASNTPATLRGYGEHWSGGQCTLYAEGEVRQAGSLAESLVLRRRIEVGLDGSTVRWHDTVANDGYQPTPHMLLYHINLGAPLLSPSTSFDAPVERVRFHTETATGAPEEYRSVPPPHPDFVEQVYSHQLSAAADGTVPVAVINWQRPDHPWGVLLRYPAAAFPYFFQWRYFSAGTYVLGLEPSTNGLEGRQQARSQGELALLGPGETRSYHVDLELLDGLDACRQAQRAIDSLRK